ncbi:MAG: 50S ribosome-binding GTPase [Actinobacteria bacterium]|nr:50S ribosome-binding GTPase [Actinomycetota bacterium]
MTEGHGTTAAARTGGADAVSPATPVDSAPLAGAVSPSQAGLAHAESPQADLPQADLPPADLPHAQSPQAELREAAAPGAGSPAAPARGAADDAGDAGDADGADVQVNLRHLESAILALRQPIVAAPLLLEVPGVEEARADRRKLVSQIDDYLLPRLRQSGSPVLVALVGSTGAGKSTLVNSIVGAQVSNTGVRRPTTNSPVLACHPDDIGWFAENVFLPTVPRVRQEGLARPGRDGLLVLAASEGMPRGVALLDTPDIDSVVEDHREFAHQFLDASDLWLFMTTGNRYADAAVWDLLTHARDRGAAVGFVLSRVPPAAEDQLVAHFDAMLAANGLGGNDRFVINETVLEDGKLPDQVSRPVRDWLAATAAQSDRRVAVLTQTMSGVLDTFRSRIPALADQVEAQFALRHDLRSAVEGAYAAAQAGADLSLRDGSLLRGEIWVRWQDFAGTGDLLRTLQSRRGAGRQRRQPAARVTELKLAVRAGIESLISSVADRAAEDALTRWRQDPGGAALLNLLATTEGQDSWRGSQPAVGLGLLPGPDASPFPSNGDEPGTGASGGNRSAVAQLGRASGDLAPRAARAVSGWQDFLMRLVRVENLTKRSIARVVSFDDESLSTLLVVALLGQDGGDGEDEGSGAVPLRVLTSLFGAGPLRDIAVRARADLRDRISLLLDEEMLRFFAVLDLPGVPEATAALRLYQATYSLEATR